MGNYDNWKQTDDKYIITSNINNHTLIKMFDMNKVALIDIISFLFSLLINSSLWLVINCVSLSLN